MYKSMLVYNQHLNNQTKSSKELPNKQHKMLTSSQNSLSSSQQILQKLFVTEVSVKNPSVKQLRINMKLMKKISEDTENYRTAVELIFVLERILYTGKKRLSLRELVYKSSSVLRNSEKSFSFSAPSGFMNSPKRDSLTSIIEKRASKQESSREQPSQKQSETIQDNQMFVSDDLSSQEKKALIQCLTKIKGNLAYTIYEIKICQLIGQLSNEQKKAQKPSEQEIYKKLLTQNTLGLDGNKTSKIQQFIQKGYQSLDGKFTSFESLYTFMSNEVLPLIQRKILSISINNHTERETFILKSITFLSDFFLHQYVLEIKINKATLIENRTFAQKLIKENLKKHQNLLMSNLTNVINEALLCPSNIQIQLGVFRLLKRMYHLCGGVSVGSVQLIELKSDAEDIGQFIKYPLMVNLKNISLYCKPIDNEDQIKQPAMFCYKVLNAKQDLYLCNQIETLSEMRFIKESKYFSSKAYAFSEEISKIYDTFDLRMSFWKYYKRVQRGQVWVYNVLIEKPNSLLIWQFYLQGYDIGFGIYKVEGFKKHSIEQYTKEVECKEILKIDKYTVIQSQPQKGFLFLKNGLYRLVFDNSYSNFRGKDLSYMIMHLESEN